MDQAWRPQAYDEYRTAGTLEQEVAGLAQLIAQVYLDIAARSPHLPDWQIEELAIDQILGPLAPPG